LWLQSSRAWQPSSIKVHLGIKSAVLADARTPGAADLTLPVWTTFERSD
jgi:hypothetical protein